MLDGKLGQGVMNYFEFHMIRFFPVYVLSYLLMTALGVFIWIQLRANFETILEGNKGTARFTTLDELLAQYKRVPAKSESDDETYPGLSGTLISRYKDQALIDTGPAHNYILGRSRSGKGQAKVIPDIDLYSRSEEKPHIIAASGKYELLAACKERLEKRGYEVSALNLIHMDYSFMYNCLELVKKAYMNKEIDEAIELCKTFSYPLYHNESAKEPVWEETAMALVNAIILALCYEFIEISEDVQKTEKYVTMFAVSNMLAELGTADAHGDTLLDKYFQSLPEGNPAKLEYSTVAYADGQMRASIFANTQARLKSFTAPKVAKMMSKSTFQFERLLKDSKPFDVTEKVTVSGIVSPSIPGDYTITYTYKNEFGVSYSHQRKVSVIESHLPSTVHANYEYIEETKVDYFKGVEDLTIPVGGEFDPLDGMTCEYYFKPQAVFLVLPDYVKTNYIIASTWIQQAYHVLSEYAGNNADKLKKRVRMILDEFGNLPAFSSIGSMLSVGAGRGILIDFYVQHPSQLKSNYEESVAEMIRDEGMNRFLLLTGSKDARTDFSEIMGKKEVVIKSRSGSLFSLEKQFTETPELRPLLAPDELGRLEEGECVIERSTMRRDLEGKSVKPYPIFNTNETKLIFSHTYLGDQFNPDIKWQKLGLPKVIDIPLREYSRDFVARIKNPLTKEGNKEIIEKKRKEFEAIMTEPESVLDNEYEGYETGKVAANFSSIDDLKLERERKLMTEAFPEGDLFTIYQLATTLYPKEVNRIDQFDYVDEYKTFVDESPHFELKDTLTQMGLFFN